MRYFTLLAILFVVGCGRNQTPPESAVGVKVADSFLAEIRAGKVEAAWQSTTAEFKSDEGQESLAQFVRKHAFIQHPMTFVEYQVSELNGLPRGQCLYQPPTTAKAGAVTVKIAVAQEEGAWKVDGVFVE